MKKTFIFLMLFVYLSSFSQKIDFNTIEKNVQDSTSVYYYEKLKYKFAYLPQSLDSIELKHLYYGKSAARQQEAPAKKYSGNFFPLYNQKKFKEAIPEGEALLKISPIDMEILGLLMQCYTYADPENKMLSLRGLQFKKLVDTVLENASGEETHKMYTVIDVADEYIIAAIQNINLQQFRRKTETTSKGIIDHWKSGKKRISFHVIYH